MPGSPYLDETPPGLWTWPRLMPWLVGLFVLEVAVCIALMWAYPGWIWVILLVLGVDLVGLLFFFFRGNGSHDAKSEGRLE